MTPAAAKRYKARRPEVTIDDVITPEIRAKRKAMMEAIADEASGPAADMAYEKSRTSMAKGGKVGSASKRADGCATKGKTKGTMVKMAMGGRTC
jgi:hypothetical protein